jgi:hypothetical protein
VLPHNKFPLIKKDIYEANNVNLKCTIWREGSQAAGATHYFPFLWHSREGTLWRRQQTRGSGLTDTGQGGGRQQVTPATSQGKQLFSRIIIMRYESGIFQQQRMKLNVCKQQKKNKNKKKKQTSHCWKEKMQMDR